MTDRSAPIVSAVQRAETPMVTGKSGDGGNRTRARFQPSGDAPFRSRNTLFAGVSTPENLSKRSSGYNRCKMCHREDSARRKRETKT